MNEIWNPLIATAIAGTQRTPLPPAADLSELGLPPADDPAAAAFQALAAAHVLRKAGFPLRAAPAPLPLPSAAQTLAPCSADMAAELSRLFTGIHRCFLPEFLLLLAQKKWRVPPRSLPDLLDACLVEGFRWDSVAPLLGAQGIWLASQNPAWSRLGAAKDETATPDPVAEPAAWLALLESARQKRTAGRKILKLLLLLLPAETMPALLGLPPDAQWSDTAARENAFLDVWATTNFCWPAEWLKTVLPLLAFGAFGLNKITPADTIALLGHAASRCRLTEGESVCADLNIHNKDPNASWRMHAGYFSVLIQYRRYLFP